MLVIRNLNLTSIQFTTPPLLSGLIHLPVTWVFVASLMFIFFYLVIS